MKKIIALLLALTMVFALAACAKQTTETPATETTTTPETTTTEENTTTEETPAAETTEAADLKVGVFYYTFADTYISSVRTALDAQLDSLGVAYQNFDGNNNQTTQNEQIQTALTDGYNLLIVNIVGNLFSRRRPERGGRGQGCGHPRDLLQPRSVRRRGEQL